jgi:hypothetical protein
VWCCCGGVTRRDLLRYAVLGGGALLTRPLEVLAAAEPEKADQKQGSGLPAAKQAMRDLIRRYASVKDDPWAMMHGVRAFGKGFTLDEGPAVDYLCSHFLETQTARGRAYLKMARGADGHFNALLKTLLEAGVGLDHPFVVQGRRQTVGDLLFSGKTLFVFDTTLSPLHGTRDEAAWSVIAFSITTPPDKAVWKNAVGQEIRLHDVIAALFAAVEQGSAEYATAMQQGIMPNQRAPITRFTCGGTHVIYSLAVAVRYGHLGEEGRRRLARILDMLIWRMKADTYLADQHYQAMTETDTPAGISRLYHLDARLKFLGHAMETIQYVRMFGLHTPTAAQEAEIRAATEILAAAILEVSRADIASFRHEAPHLYALLIGDACHAYHGLTMAKGVNQV